MDGIALRLPDAPYSSEVWAIQWGGEGGELEYMPALHKPNRKLTVDDYDTIVKPFVDAWQAEHDRQVLVQQEAEAKARDLYNSEEQRFLRLRTERDIRLSATDYYVMEDYPSDVEIKEQVLAYRQALRDLPNQPGAPWTDDTIPWPQNPLENSTVTNAMRHYQPLS